MYEDGEICIYVGKPKRGTGWVNGSKQRTHYHLTTMGWRKPDGTTYSERYIQPLFDTFTPGGKKP